MTCGMNLGLDLEALRRIYRTRDVEEGVHVEDEVHLEVALLPVLPEEAMRAIVREILREGGWREVEGGGLEKTFGAAVAELSPDGRAVTLRAKGEVTVTASGRAAVVEAGAEKAAEREAERLAREQLEKRAREAREAIAVENLRELARHEPALREDVQKALNRTYRRALEERARQMGEVESIQERGSEGGTYEVTVVVKA